jgi:hypothetical protein
MRRRVSLVLRYLRLYTNKNLLKVKTCIIPKSYIQDKLVQYQGSKGQDTTSDDYPIPTYNFIPAIL